LNHRAERRFADRLLVLIFSKRAISMGLHTGVSGLLSRRSPYPRRGCRGGRRRARSRWRGP